MDLPIDDGTTLLGTRLRRLLAQLDGAVDESYRQAGLDYRARYTPIVRALMRDRQATIRALSTITGVSHSATSQTVAEMASRGLVATATGPSDARERVVTLTRRAIGLLPRLERRWATIDAAARSLDAELSAGLSAVVAEALDALDRRSFEARIADADCTPGPARRRHANPD